MSEIVGVRALGTPSKREALLFGRIISVRLDESMSEDIPTWTSISRDLSEETKDRLRQDMALQDFLEQNGIIERVPLEVLSRLQFDLKHLKPLLESYHVNPLEPDHPDLQLAFEQAIEAFAGLPRMFSDAYSRQSARLYLEEHQELKEKVMADRMESYIFQLSDGWRVQVLDFLTRLCACAANSQYNNVTCILEDIPNQEEEENELTSERRRAFYDVIISNIPTPSEQTSWEQIIEFRNENQDQYLTFRRWIDKTVRGDLPISELDDELNHLVNKYQEYMRVKRMEWKSSRLRTLVSIPLDIARGILTLNAEMVTRPFFELNKHYITLLDAELKAPHREISYLVRSEEQFDH